jgi:protein-S-isoprenylcysteine O-methyltransferase Ste14
MVFGVFMIYIGAGILFDSFLCLLVILVLFSLAVIYLRFSEEKRLIRDFGDEYIEYRKKVPMIFPFLPGRL